MPQFSADEILGARQREMEARHLIQHPDEVLTLWKAKEWEKLIPYADAVAADAPEDLIHTDQALYRTLRKAITEIRIRGMNFNPAELRRLAALTPPTA